MTSSKYINVVLERHNYEDLKTLGQVPDSFNDVITPLLKEKQTEIKAIRTAREQKAV